MFVFLDKNKVKVSLGAFLCTYLDCMAVNIKKNSWTMPIFFSFLGS